MTIILNSEYVADPLFVLPDFRRVQDSFVTFDTRDSFARRYIK